MSTIIISQDQLVQAAHWEMWSICLWGNPKADVICGSCKRPFATRDYRPFRKGGIVANCPHCGMWNRANINMS